MPKIVIKEFVLSKCTKKYVIQSDLFLEWIFVRIYDFSKPAGNQKISERDESVFGFELVKVGFEVSVTFLDGLTVGPQRKMDVSQNPLAARILK